MSQREPDSSNGVRMDQSGLVVQHGVQVQHVGEVLLPLVSEPSQTLSGVRFPILAGPRPGLRIEVPHRPPIGCPKVFSRTRNLDLEPELLRRLPKISSEPLTFCAGNSNPPVQ